jgi:tetratricopeptide (TPR) repeat protein
MSSEESVRTDLLQRAARGDAEALLERWAEARQDCTPVLRLQPEHTAALYLRGHAYQRLGRHAKAAEDFAAALRAESELAPSLADVQNALDLGPSARANYERAWAYLNARAERRFLGLAHLLAEKALVLAPQDRTAWLTLGPAYYRLDQWERAAAVLEKERHVKPGVTTAFSLYVLAMSYQRLDQDGKAKECFAAAEAWQRDQKRLASQHAPALAAFRSEAMAVLGLR